MWTQHLSSSCTTTKEPPVYPSRNCIRWPVSYAVALSCWIHICTPSGWGTPKLCHLVTSLQPSEPQLTYENAKQHVFYGLIIILMGNTPLGEEIAKIANKDPKQWIFFLVVGTSMKVDGIQKLFRMFVQSVPKAVHEQGSPP